MLLGGLAPSQVAPAKGRPVPCSFHMFQHMQKLASSSCTHLSAAVSVLLAIVSKVVQPYAPHELNCTTPSRVYLLQPFQHQQLLQTTRRLQACADKQSRQHLVAVLSNMSTVLSKLVLVLSNKAVVLSATCSTVEQALMRQQQLQLSTRFRYEPVSCAGGYLT